MPFTEIKAAGPDIADGVYPVMLTDIKGDPEDPNRPKTVTAQRGPNAGKDIELWDWVFVINVPGGHPLDGTPIEASTSTASGPRSKMYAWLTALFNGISPTVGSSFEKTDLIGRMALATIRKDEGGWPRLENLGAMPASMQQQAYAAATAAPVAASAPVAAPVAAAPVAAPAAPLAASLPIQQIVPPQPVGDPAGQFVQPAPVASVAQAPLREQVAAGDDLPF